MVPSGTVTLVFTDIEGSTRAWEAHPDAMRLALARHDTILRSVIEAADGYVFKTVGDAFCAAFGDAVTGVRAAVDIQRALDHEIWPEDTPIRVRIGVHSGRCDERDGDYFGPTVNRVARLQSTAHGGQTIVSGATAELIAAGLPEGIVLRDLGAHRLKDLGRPERVFQVCGEGLSDGFAPLRSLGNPDLANNLPEQVSSFIGRERELVEVLELLGSSRLVTLAGLGGTGKTRLALQAAAELLDSSGDGVWFVDLAPLTDAQLVAPTIASVLGVREDASRSTLATLVAETSDRELLLVLDNCEHLVDPTAAIVDALLRGSPGMHVLTTSREPLGITGEHVYRVPPLSIPDDTETDAAVLANCEAVRMFLARAVEHAPRFATQPPDLEVVARVCRRLDGIPLAIELASARLTSLSVEELDARLDQRFRILSRGSRTSAPRQQTLRALLDWSHELLHASEQRMLARLSVFADSWDIAAAEAVVGEEAGDDPQVLDDLTALVDKSLVQISIGETVTRYRLLETVRAYAAERLVALGHLEKPRLHAAHASHYLAVAEAAEPHLIRADQAEWVARLGTEYDDLRAALAYELTRDDPDEGLRLGVALHRFWDATGRSGEGVEILTALLQKPTARPTTLLRGRALAALADLQMGIASYEAAERASAEALKIGRAELDDRLTAEGLAGLAYVAYRRGDAPTALRYTGEAVVRARASGDSHVLAGVLSRRGIALSQLGDTETARTLFEESLTRYREAGDLRLAARILTNLAVDAIDVGDHATARSRLTESLGIGRNLGDTDLLVTSELNLGAVAHLEGDYDEARELLLRVLRAGRRISVTPLVPYALLTLAAAPEYDPHAASQVFGAVDALIDRTGEQLESGASRLRATVIARLRDHLGDSNFDHAYATGRTLTRSEAIDLALEQ